VSGCVDELFEGHDSLPADAYRSVMPPYHANAPCGCRASCACSIARISNLDATTITWPLKNHARHQTTEYSTGTCRPVIPSSRRAALQAHFIGPTTVQAGHHFPRQEGGHLRPRLLLAPAPRVQARNNAAREQRLLGPQAAAELKTRPGVRQELGEPRIDRAHDLGMRTRRSTA